MPALKRSYLGLLVAALALGGAFHACRKAAQPPTQTSVGLPESAMSIVQARDLKPDDITAALKTYIPTGRYDDYYLFASGGHSGQVLVIGLPSMRLLKVIAVFTPEPWQGYGYGVKESPIGIGEGTKFRGKPLTWADTHHPALSETNGDYDGKYLFINDKANGRIGVIDLRDFETKQIVANPITFNSHGATFVTPNTEYVIESSQFSVPFSDKYVPLEKYKEKYRGMVTLWKFDRDKGRIDPARSFAIELPPYWQDLADAGKLASDGWFFINSLNTEMATGGIEEGNPPIEAGSAERDMDYLHIINWKKAEQVVQAGKFKTINGMRVIPLDTAVAEGLIYLTPEPKSPHGVDICPEGNHIVVSGKLDPHVTIYTMERIRKAIETQDFEGKDPYGIPILRFDAVKEAQVEVGLGPLHTQFDNQGYAYTSLFLDTAVARWTLGNCKYKAPEPPWTLVQKIPVHYNVGHIATAEGDTVEPDGLYLVSLNKWSVDRFANVGPLEPQNLQLIDITPTGANMKLLYDMPIGIGEPHYGQIIKADKLHSWEVYPEVGWDPLHQQKSKYGTLQSRIERHGRNVDVYMTAIRSHYDPEHIVVRKGDHVRVHITNLERTRDATHGFAITGYNINASIEPGETATVEFTADREGVFPYYCTEFCSALHLEMAGYLLVKP